MDELSIRDKLACFIAARFRLTNPVDVANTLAPFVDKLLADAWEEGYEAAGFDIAFQRDSTNPYRNRQENR